MEVEFARVQSLSMSHILAVAACSAFVTGGRSAYESTAAITLDFDHSAYARMMKMVDATAETQT